MVLPQSISKLRAKPAPLSMLLLMGFCMAIYLRVIIGGVEVRTSGIAGLIFAACLAVLIWANGIKPVKPNRRSIIVGLLGGIFLCLPSVVVYLKNGHSYPAGNYFTWAIVVSIVAIIEEAFLRGTLFDTVSRWRGITTALVVTSLAFALLHVPLYGWQILPLDIAVGFWLGTLRIVSKDFAAPAIAHVFADLAGWWLR